MERTLLSFDINAVYINKDYEPYAIKRDKEVEELLKSNGISLFRFKDQVIFEEGEILKPDNRPYTIFTPYKNRWMKKLNENSGSHYSDKSEKHNNFYPCSYPFPSLQEIRLQEKRHQGQAI